MLCVLVRALLRSFSVVEVGESKEDFLEEVAFDLRLETWTGKRINKVGWQSFQEVGSIMHKLYRSRSLSTYGAITGNFLWMPCEVQGNCMWWDWRSSVIEIIILVGYSQQRGLYPGRWGIYWKTWNRWLTWWPLDSTCWQQDVGWLRGVIYYGRESSQRLTTKFWWDIKATRLKLWLERKDRSKEIEI